jgi:hypothetical protein
MSNQAPDQKWLEDAKLKMTFGSKRIFDHKFAQRQPSRFAKRIGGLISSLFVKRAGGDLIPLLPKEGLGVVDNLALTKRSWGD